jgi:hypothetical protein
VHWRGEKRDLIGMVNIGSSGEQERDQFDTSFCASKVERGAIALIVLIDWCSMIQEQLDDLQMTILTSEMEWRRFSSLRNGEEKMGKVIYEDKGPLQFLSSPHESRARRPRQWLQERRLAEEECNRSRDTVRREEKAGGELYLSHSHWRLDQATH